MTAEVVKFKTAWSQDVTHFQGQQTNELRRSMYEKNVTSTADQTNPGGEFGGGGDTVVIETNPAGESGTFAQCELKFHPAIPEPPTCSQSFKPQGFQGEPYTLETKGSIPAPDMSALYTQSEESTQFILAPPESRYTRMAYTQTYHHQSGTGAGGDVDGFNYFGATGVGDAVVQVGNWVEGADVVSFVKNTIGQSTFIIDNLHQFPQYQGDYRTWFANNPRTERWIDKGQIGMMNYTDSTAPEPGLLDGMDLDIDRQKPFLENGPTDRTQIEGDCRVHMKQVQHAAARVRTVGAPVPEGKDTITVMPDVTHIGALPGMKLSAVRLDSFRLHKIVDFIDQHKAIGKRSHYGGGHWITEGGGMGYWAAARSVGLGVGVPETATITAYENIDSTPLLANPSGQPSDPVLENPPYRLNQTGPKWAPGTPSTHSITYDADDLGGSWNREFHRAKYSHRIRGGEEFQEDFIERLGSTNAYKEVLVPQFPVSKFTRNPLNGKISTFGGWLPDEYIRNLYDHEYTQADVDEIIAPSWRIVAKEYPDPGTSKPYKVQSPRDDSVAWRWPNYPVRAIGSWKDEQTGWFKHRNQSEYVVEFYNSIHGPYDSQIEVRYDPVAIPGDDSGAKPLRAANWYYKDGYSAGKTAMLQDVNNVLVDVDATLVPNEMPPTFSKPFTKRFLRVPLAGLSTAWETKGIWIAPDPRYQVDFSNQAGAQVQSGRDFFTLVSPSSAPRVSGYATQNGWGVNRLSRQEVASSAGLDNYEDFVGVNLNPQNDDVSTLRLWSSWPIIGQGSAVLRLPSANTSNSDFPSVIGTGIVVPRHTGAKLREVAYAEAIWADMSGQGNPGGDVSDTDPPEDPPLNSSNIQALDTISRDTLGPQVIGNWVHQSCVCSYVSSAGLYSVMNWGPLQAFYGDPYPNVDGQRYNTGGEGATYRVRGAPTGMTDPGEIAEWAQGVLDSGSTLVSFEVNGEIVTEGTQRNAFVNYACNQLSTMMGAFKQVPKFIGSNFQTVGTDYPNQKDTHQYAHWKDVVAEVAEAPAKRSDGWVISDSDLANIGIQTNGESNIIEVARDLYEYLQPQKTERGATWYNEVFWPEHFANSEELAEERTDAWEEWRSKIDIKNELTGKRYTAEQNRDQNQEIADDYQTLIDSGEGSQQDVEFWTEQRDLYQALADEFQSRVDDLQPLIDEAQAEQDAAQEAYDEVHTEYIVLNGRHLDVREDMERISRGGTLLDFRIINWIEQRQEMLDKGYTEEEIRAGHPAVFLNTHPNYEGQLLHSLMVMSVARYPGVGTTMKAELAAAQAVSLTAAILGDIDWDDVEFYDPTMGPPDVVDYDEGVRCTKAYGVDHDGWADATESQESWTDPTSVNIIEFDGVPAGRESVEYTSLYDNTATWHAYTGDNKKTDVQGRPHWLVAPFLGTEEPNGFKYESKDLEDFNVANSVDTGAWPPGDSFLRSNATAFITQYGFGTSGPVGINSPTMFDTSPLNRHWQTTPTGGSCQFKRILGDIERDKEPPDNDGIQPGSPDVLTWSTDIEHFTSMASMQLYMDTKNRAWSIGQNQRVTVELLEEEGETFTPEEREAMIQSLEENPTFRRPPYAELESACFMTVHPVSPSEVQQYYYAEPDPNPPQGEDVKQVYTWPLYETIEQAEKQDLSFAGSGTAETLDIDGTDWYYPSTLFVEGDDEADPPVPDTPGSHVQLYDPPEDALIEQIPYVPPA